MQLFAITEIGKDWDDAHKQLIADDGVFDASTSHRSDIESLASERLNRTTTMASVNRRVLPGFSLTLGYTVFYLSLLVLIPIAGGLPASARCRSTSFCGAVWTERARRPIG